MSALLQSVSRTAVYAASFRFRAAASRRAAPPVILALSLAALLALNGCVQDAQPPETAPPTAAASPTTDGTDASAATGPPASEPADTVGATPSNPDPNTVTEDQMTDLLLLHAQLKTDLGAAYSDAWIDDGQLYVAVTTPDSEAAVYGAGAIPVRTEFSEAQLHEAADDFKAWLGTDAAPQVQLHWLGTSGRTGSITVRVPVEQVQPLTDALAQHQPAGAVRVIVEESSGPTTPLGTNAP